MRARCLVLAVFSLWVLAFGGLAFGGEGMVALVTCDASCPIEGTDFYTDCGNGTVTDNRSGLVWLANANCFGQLSWQDAMGVVAGLGDLSAQACAGMEPDECDCGLSDHSSPGEWRLPSIAEWKAMISFGWDSDSCDTAIANDMGNGCWEQGCVEAHQCSLYDVQSSEYWSASIYVADPIYAWCSDLAAGQVGMLARESSAYVWPVRGGQ